MSSVCPRKTDDTVDLVVPYMGMRFNVNTGWSIERHILFTGEYERLIASIIERALNHGDAALDVGANVGAHTLHMARRVGSGGSIVSVEPHPEVAARLRANLELNGMSQVQVLQAAFSDADGSTEFFGFDPAAPKKGISSLKPDSRASVPITVDTISGESFAKRFTFDSLALIKVDVEGAEEIVLRELRRTIQQHQPVVIFEHHKPHWDKFDHSVQRVLAQFKEDDYTCHIVDRNIMPLRDEVPEECDILCVPRASEFQT